MDYPGQKSGLCQYSCLPTLIISNLGPMCVKRMESHVEESSLAPGCIQRTAVLDLRDCIGRSRTHCIARLRHSTHIVAIPHLHITESACLSLLGLIY